MSADPDMTFTHDIGGKPVRFRFGTVRFWLRYASRLKELMASRDETFTEELLALVQSAAADDIDIGDLMTYADLLEFAYELPMHATVQDMQKKRLRSQSQSAVSSSAPDAATEPAPMHQQINAPPSSIAPHVAAGDVTIATTVSGT